MSGVLGFGICTALAVLIVLASCVRPLLIALRVRKSAARVASHPVHRSFASLAAAGADTATALGGVGRELGRLLKILIEARETLALVSALLRI